MTEENQNSDGEDQVNDDAVESGEGTTESGDVASAAADEGVTAESSEQEQAAEASVTETTPEAAPTPPAPSGDEETFVTWPVEKDHGSVTRMLTQDAPDVDLSDEEEVSGGGMNLVLVLLIIAAVVGGVFQLRIVSSAEALEAKRIERIAKEEAFLKEQLAKQKKYGVLRIESNPSQAVVVKDGEAIQVEVMPTAAAAVPAGGDAPPAPGAAAPAKAPAAATPTPAAPAAPAAPATAGAAGGVKAGMTPMNIMNLDIAQTYKFRVEKAGYESFEFSIAEHLWTKDPTTNEYKFFKSIELTPINCEYWFLYDAKQRREMKFPGKCTKKPEKTCSTDDDCKDNGPCDSAPGKAECIAHYDNAVARGTAVTDCTCKLPPELTAPQ